MSSLIPYRYRNSMTRPENSIWNDDFFRPFFFGQDVWANSFHVDVRDDGDNYVLEADLPGVKKDQVNIEVDNGVLTISAEWNNECKDKKCGYILSERKSGKVQRSFSVDNVQEDAITADYTDGVLKLTMPKKTEQARSGRHIEIN